MIQKIGAENPSFKGARVNILASSDSHGNIMRLPRVLKTIENNAKEIFPKAEEKSTANFLTFIGDWFINPSKKGFLTHPELSNGDLQNVALLRTIDNIKATLKKLATKASGVIDGKIGLLNVLFTLGMALYNNGDVFAAKETFEEALPLFQENFDGNKELDERYHAIMSILEPINENLQ